MFGAGAARYSRPGEWEYVDPKGVIQGPFSSKEVLKWADAGFFTPDQQVDCPCSHCHLDLGHLCFFLEALTPMRTLRSC